MRIDDLRHALETVAADAPPGRGDVHSTVRRGRRLLATRRLAVSAVALAVVGGVIGVSFGVRDRHSVVVAAMTRTVEVDLPSEHFMPSGDLVSTSDGEGGTLRAVVGIRTPTADAKGQLVFFFRNQTFVGWDAGQEATSVFNLEPAGPRAFEVTYVNDAAGDPIIGGSLPPAIVTYTWNGRQMVPTPKPPPGVYGLNDPSANAIRVKLMP